MRTMAILAAAAVTVGLAGGYAWTAWTAPPPRLPKHPRAAFMPLPASPEERPLALDQQWTAEADDANQAAPAAVPAADESPAP